MGEQFFVVCRLASLALNLRAIHGEYTHNLDEPTNVKCRWV